MTNPLSQLLFIAFLAAGLLLTAPLMAQSTDTPQTQPGAPETITPDELPSGHPDISGMTGDERSSMPPARPDTGDLPQGHPDIEGMTGEQRSSMPPATSGTGDLPQGHPNIAGMGGQGGSAMADSAPLPLTDPPPEGGNWPLAGKVLVGAFALVFAVMMLTTIARRRQSTLFVEVSAALSDDDLRDLAAKALDPELTLGFSAADRQQLHDRYDEALAHRRAQRAHPDLFADPDLDTTPPA